MKNIRTIRNTIRSIIEEPVYADRVNLADQIIMVLLVEEWTHKRGENLDWDDLTDAEFRTCVMWARDNRKMFGPDHSIRTIKEMREVFPGLSLVAARDFVRGY